MYEFLAKLCNTSCSLDVNEAPRGLKVTITNSRGKFSQVVIEKDAKDKDVKNVLNAAFVMLEADGATGTVEEDES